MKMLKLFEQWRAQKLDSEIDESSRELFKALDALALEKHTVESPFSQNTMRKIRQTTNEGEGMNAVSSTFDFLRRWRLGASVVSLALVLLVCVQVMNKIDNPHEIYRTQSTAPVAPAVENKIAEPKGKVEPEKKQLKDEENIAIANEKIISRLGEADKKREAMAIDASPVTVRKPEQVSMLASSADKQAPAMNQEGALGRSQSMPRTRVEAFAKAGAGIPADAFYYHSEPSSESYGQYEENPRFDPALTPLSTFAIDVDTGSYTNTRRFLTRGQLPPKDAVRVEEFINYFDYAYESSTSEPFAVTFEVAPSPIDKEYHLLRVGIKARTAPQNSELGWNLVFLVDVSGSMNDVNKLPLVKESLKLLAKNMRAIDRISLVTYAGSAGVVLDSTPGSEKEKILSAIDALGAGGSTNGSGGITAAYEVAQKNMIKGSVNRVVLATDGDFNVGISSFDGLMSLIEEKRRSGITLTTLGFGEGNINEKSMEQLANRGNGNYFYIDSFREARKVLEEGLAANMQVVAKDVKLQMEFNPAVVKQYRLIGFDNRKLNKEDFTNDAKDAGEIGSGHTVTALYEIVLQDSPLAKKINEELRYQKEAAKAAPELVKSDELGFLKIRYKEPEADVSKPLSFAINRSQVKAAAESSSDFNFAAAVVYFGEILRQSNFLGSYTLDDVITVAKQHRGTDASGQRAEFIKLVEDAKSLKK